MLLFCFLNLSLVSAEENSTQDIINVCDDDSIEEVNVLTSDGSDQEEVLGASESGNFTELSKKINSADGVLELDKDYVYTSGDTVEQTGIAVKKTITINGNGHTIDGSNLVRIFNIKGTNIVLNNITFVNGKINGYGGAIYISGTNTTIDNCEFSNNLAATYRGGAICNSGVNTTINNCNFSKNSASWSGGAIYSNGKNFKVNNSNFDGNYAKLKTFYSDDGGGAIHSAGSYAEISNSTFTNNKIVAYGGAIRIEGSNSKLSNSKFENNTGGDGGAVAWHGSYGNLDNCSFFGNYASALDGGALSWYSYGGKASDSVFENNSAAYRGGGVIYQTNYGTLDNLTFIGNNASCGAGLFAPSTSTSNTVNNHGTLSNSRFINNHALYGGAGADITAHFKIINSTFVNNTANNYGGAVSVAYGEIDNSTFINNTATFGGAIYAQNSTISDSTFEDNNAPYGKSIYILNSSDLTDNEVPDDEITVVDNLSRTTVGIDSLTDNLFNTSDGYYGYCSERYVDRPYDGLHDSSLALLRNAKNGQPVAEYLKILIYQYVDRTDDLKNYTLEDYVWAFTDYEYWNSTDPIVQDVINIYNSGFRVPTENACKVLSNGTLMYFNFSSLITPTAQQNLFLFKFAYGDVINATLIKEALNKTLLVGDNAEFRIVVNNKGNSTIYDIFVDDKDYSSGLLYVGWRNETGNWTYDNLTKKWRLDKLESGNSATLILIFNATVSGNLINNVTGGVGNKNITNSTDNVTVCNPSLTVNKKTLTKTVKIGEKALFEIIVKNTCEIGLEDVYVLESDYGSGLEYLDYVSVKGNWTHSVNSEGKHVFRLNGTLGINETAVFRVIFNTTKMGNFTNHVMAGIKNTTLSNSSNVTEVINETTPENPESDENTEEVTDEIKILDEDNEIEMKHSMDKAATGNPIFILLLVLISLPIRVFKK